MTVLYHKKILLLGLLFVFLVFLGLSRYIPEEGNINEEILSLE